MKDTYHDMKAVQAIAPAVLAAAATGAAIDLSGFDSAVLVVNTGAIVASGDFGVKLQESNTTTEADFADVAPADRLGAIPATLTANTTYRLGYIGSKRKRYIRAVVTKAGGTSIAVAAVAVLGHPAIAPVAA
ncbi:hypothetical protein C8J36_102636 [Rhizobium sp. PP-F2F-G48]|uniref:hypothetical protein n=1 Tax=Rhizobium sp. PP-F2F-G48 TaxID=2135651 RepID=UPI00104FBE46|nr:hypothetical protein [Rhizobium sp. PP-F2F-G48]TCM57833.1 hypothetical protein C8J36_102636 [Rhizobium sp. PP-F2F-G48]